MLGLCTVELSELPTKWFAECIDQLVRSLDELYPPSTEYTVNVSIP